ncbi:unnamed protein product [Linum tenue]|uniref:Uncharacterized protein n=1 Tax=Linum tenue TaxID=586396 RepID=A0AAV0NQ64_9ROSI|nr:unnamed protein product [Linum tenue]
MGEAPISELLHYPEREILRRYELRLLRCTYCPPSMDSLFQCQSSPSDVLSLSSKQHESINQVLSYIEDGDYLQALSLDVATELLSLGVAEENENDADDQVCSKLLAHVERFVMSGIGSDDFDEIACRAIFVLCIGVAALFYFTQSNITGPLDEVSSPPLPFQFAEGSNMIDWETWSRNQLMSEGADLHGMCSNLLYIVLAKILVMKTKDLLCEGSVSSTYAVRSTSWWLSRLLFTEQRVLSQPSSLLFDLLQVSVSETLNHFGTVEKVSNYWGANLLGEEASTLVSVAHLEAGIIQRLYGLVDSARKHIGSAEAAAGLQLSVTGVLGYRNDPQVKPTAQRVLLLNRTSLSNGGGGSSARYNPLSKLVEDSLDPQKTDESESCDILKKPILFDKGCKVGTALLQDEICGPSLLSPTQQAVILTHCYMIQKGSQHDELTKWDVAPFVEAIDSQPSSLFTLEFFCNLLRVRWESTRSNTKLRAVEMMGKLVENLEKSFPGVARRIPFCYVANFPTIPTLKKEYGELLLSCGLVGEAIKIFEALQLWDNLIQCKCLLGQKTAAVELIKMRSLKCLTTQGYDFMCSLGDVTNDDSCYEKALKVSNYNSARAMRALARSAYNRGVYEQSKTLWESAMALNSLNPDGWFALGAAALKKIIVTWQAVEALQRVADITGKRIDVKLVVRIMEEMERRNSSIGSRIPLSSYENEPTSQSGNPVCSTEAEGNVSETLLLLELLGKILQKMVKNVSRPEIWGLYARWHKIKGDPIMCSEALLKQIRGYQGSDLWKDSDRFKKFAHASVELCEVYMDMSASTSSCTKLSSAEMHLSNTIRQAKSFSDTQEFQDLQACLDTVRAKLKSRTTLAP